MRSQLHLVVEIAFCIPGITPKWKLIAGLLVMLPSAFLGGQVATGTAQQTAAGGAVTRAPAP